MKTNKPLTLKEKKFVKMYVSTFNGTEAYQVTHPKANRDTSRAEAPRVLASPSVQSAIIEELEAVGLNNEYIATKHKDLLNAQKPVYFDGIKIDETPDHNVQLETLKHVAKLKGLVGNDSGNITNNTLNLFTDQITPDKLKDLTEKVRILRQSLGQSI